MNPVGFDCAFVAIPYIVSETTTPQPALADWKTSDREACSRVVYQLAIKRVNPGEMEHSNIPWSARRTMNSGQLVGNAWQSTTIPQPAKISEPRVSFDGCTHRTCRR